MPADSGGWGAEAVAVVQTAVIKSVQSALALPKDDPARADAIGKVRDETTKWVAKYRRDGTFQGRASYG